MKFYQVISYFYDDGRTSASITNVIEAEEKPQNTHFTLKNMMFTLIISAPNNKRRNLLKIPFAHERQVIKMKKILLSLKYIPN